MKDHFRDEMTKPDWQLIMEMKKLFQILWKSQEEKKRQKQKKRIKQFFFKFENKVLQKTGTLWSNHQLLIKQKQGNEKSVQVHTGLININIILHIYMCYLSCFTMVNILLIVYLQFEIWHHFIFGSRLYCVFFSMESRYISHPFSIVVLIHDLTIWLKVNCC